MIHHTVVVLLFLMSVGKRIFKVFFIIPLFISSVQHYPGGWQEWVKNEQLK